MGLAYRQNGDYDDYDMAIADYTQAIELNPNYAAAYFNRGLAFRRKGDLDHAAKAYADSLATFPGYHRASAGLAKVRAAQGRFDDAIELYRAAMNVIPMPAYAAALGDVYRRAGNREQAEKQYRLVEYIARLNDINRVVYNRELAMFYADHDLRLDQALELARRELQIRRDVYTWDALAFALYKNGHIDEAARADRNALRMGTRDALLFYHAGMIQARLNDRERAQHYLVLALRTNAQFHVFYADDARRMLREFAERPPVEKSAAGRAGASDS
jgi:tetratricopeptide (TPR) repeat protein